VIVTFNEIEVTFRKAALGVGVPLGLAEDMGRMNHWLAARGGMAMASAVALLDALDSKESGKGTLVPNGEGWEVVPEAGQRLSALYAGGASCDWLCAHNATLWLKQVDFPLWVLIATALASADQKRQIRMRLRQDIGPQVQAICSLGNICSEGPMLRPFLNNAPGLIQLRPSRAEYLPSHPVSIPARPDDAVFAKGVMVGEALWEQVQHYAKRTLVPASASSRAGAGAGEIDTD